MNECFWCERPITDSVNEFHITAHGLDVFVELCDRCYFPNEPSSMELAEKWTRIMSEPLLVEIRKANE